MEDSASGVGMYDEIFLTKDLFDTIDVTAKGTDQNEYQTFKIVMPTQQEEEYTEDKTYIESSLESLFNMYVFMF